MMQFNQRQMQQAMKRMGVSQVDIPAREVVIRTDDKEIVISDPQVAKVNMMGSTSYQISGKEMERSLSTEPEIGEEDIKTVMEQAGVERDAALKSIKESKGDLAQAILQLRS
ncbi:MAG: nascent polypeptide-associated complex protein [Candidatus Woesearchaeota archaeon]